ncbi:hypothetical protein Sme01_60520 [Sphaerisporangium melleum]|uniref:Uncharacterized protein n=1 Tax=Sphaerisporangium melleum TaxID=321316 RepID=A0A917RB10_9ACTN|nr:hypothetical protein GCM10007964_46710 [Sphaerisporangium melleum]GII73576.1 hypothetical protein Sme01_60520 [Sphaerisporangium melleum]
MSEGCESIGPRRRRSIAYYDDHGVAVARASVPVRGISVRALDDLQADLEPVFGKDWLQ